MMERKQLRKREVKNELWAVVESSGRSGPLAFVGEREGLSVCCLLSVLRCIDRLRPQRLAEEMPESCPWLSAFALKCVSACVLARALRLSQPTEAVR